MHNFHIAILGAMPQEIGETINHLSEVRKIKFGDLEIVKGIWCDGNSNHKISISIAWSGWGKVSAARAATRLISSISKNENPVDLLLFTGVAGAISSNLKQWDIVIADSLIQHDMDSRPIFDKYVIPALLKKKIIIPENLVNWANDSIKNGLIENTDLSLFGTVYKGLIATGDKFIGSSEKLSDLKSNIPDGIAVEMEGASVAQVAEQENVPCLIIRIISDNADDDAVTNFDSFLTEYETKSWKIINTLLMNLKEYNYLIKN